MSDARRCRRGIALGSPRTPPPATRHRNTNNSKGHHQTCVARELVPPPHPGGNGPIRHDRLCPATPARISTRETVNDSLTVTIVAAQGDSVGVSAPVDLEVYLRGQRYAVIGRGAPGALVRAAPAKSLDGAVAEVFRYPSGERVCSLTLIAPSRPASAETPKAPPTPEQVRLVAERARADTMRRRLAGLDSALKNFREDDFILRTGFEYASGSGFRDKDPHLQGSVAYNIGLGTTSIGGIVSPVTGALRSLLGLPRDTMPPAMIYLWERPFRISATAMAERTTSVKERRIYDCRPTVFRRGETLPGGARRICARPDTMIVEGDTSFVLYAPRLSDVQSGVPDTRGVWQVGGLFRFETPLFGNKGVFIGPALAVGFQTNPVGSDSASESLVRFRRWGLSFRQLDTDGKERFSFSALRGPLYTFRERVTTFDSAFVRTHPEVNQIYRRLRQDESGAFSMVTPDTTLVAEGWAYRLMFRPIPNIYLRGMGQFPTQGRPFASIAIMADLSLTDALKAVGLYVPSTTSSPSGASGSSPAPAPPAPPPSGT